MITLPGPLEEWASQGRDGADRDVGSVKGIRSHRCDAGERSAKPGQGSTALRSVGGAAVRKDGGAAACGESGQWAVR